MCAPFARLDVEQKDIVVCLDCAIISSRTANSSPVKLVNESIKKLQFAKISFFDRADERRDSLFSDASADSPRRASRFL